MNRSSKRTLTMGSLASCLLLIVTACAQGGETREVSGDSVAGKAAGSAPDDLDGVTMTFTSYGGGFQDGQETAFVEPFKEATGAEVLTDEPTDIAKVQTQVESENILWDVVDAGPDDVAAKCGTLFEPIDYSIVDASKLPTLTPKHKCYVPTLAYAYGFFYDADTYKQDPPDGWEDFFDTKKYPGTRAIDGRPVPTTGTMEAALLADGVAPEDLYPLDIDRALATYDKIADDAIYWETGAQQTQMAEAGEADMVFAWSGRIYEANKNGANFRPVWNEALTLYDVLAVLKDSPNKNAAMAFINYSLGAEQQAKMAELTSYSPVNVDSEPKFDEMGKQFNATVPEHLEQQVALDVPYWAEHQEEIGAAWASWLNE